MQITSLTFSTDKKFINLKITGASDLTTINLWTHKTYKDYTKLINLNSKLTGSAEEDINIYPSDINENYFDGIYYIEVIDSTTKSIAALAELLKYHECLINKTLKLINNDCDACDKASLEATNISLAIKALTYAVKSLAINAMQTIIKYLDLACVDSCSGCAAENSNIYDTSTQEYNNPSTIIINIDGGTT